MVCALERGGGRKKEREEMPDWLPAFPLKGESPGCTLPLMDEAAFWGSSRPSASLADPCPSCL